MKTGKIRGLNDKVLVGALSNHQMVLQGCIAFIRSHARWQWVWRVWATVVSGAVGYPYAEEVVQWVIAHI